MERRLLTNSRLACFCDCPQKEEFAYNRRIRPVAKLLPLLFGTLAHKALESWWQPKLSGIDRLTNALKTIRENGDDLSEFDLVRAEEVMIGYHARWIDDQDSTIKTIHVEHTFRVPMLHPITGERSEHWDLGGQIDKIAEKDGQHFLVEHKTSSEDFSPGSDYQQRTQLSTQIGQYWEAAKSLGYNIRGCIYDVLRRPTLKPLKATGNIRYRKDGQPYANQRLQDETTEEYRLRLREDISNNPDEYYQRFIVVRFPNEEKAASLDRWNIGALITWSQEHNAHPKFTKSCKQYGTPCAYLGVCSGFTSIDDPTKFRVADTENEELR